MRIGELAKSLGTTTHAVRFYERRGLLPAAVRDRSGYRVYTGADSERLRLLIGLRQLDLPLDQAAELAAMCAAGRCAEVSGGLRAAIIEKRQELSRRIGELTYLDRHLAHLGGELADGKSPRNLVIVGKEDRDASAL